MSRERFSHLRPLGADKGFTLMELLLVLLILAILTAMVVPRLTGRSEQARITACVSDIESNLSVVLDLYELDNGCFPTTQQGLEALVKEPETPPVPSNWRGPYIKNAKLPRDPWGNPYRFVSPGAHNTLGYDLYSVGPDGIEGTEDDIKNWE
ncbi:MAG: type II secretion system major pseudopilin GspG [Candidatus Zixiibacteriota bacterium]